MKEPKNPIQIIKDLQVIDPKQINDVKLPYTIGSKSVFMYVQEGEKPIYFKRKTNVAKLNTKTGVMDLELIAIKYKIGKISKLGREFSLWINANGQKITEETKRFNNG